MYAFRISFKLHINLYGCNDSNEKQMLSVNIHLIHALNVIEKEITKTNCIANMSSCGVNQRKKPCTNRNETHINSVISVNSNYLFFRHFDKVG